jgi:hypothetical protein
MVELVPLGSAIVAGVFAVTLARQYNSRRRLHQLIWAVSMILFSLGAFLEFVMSIVTVGGPLFDLYYLLIGPETGLLGAGVVYLMRPRLGKYVLYAVIALSACLLVSVAVWPVDLSGLVAGLSPPATYQQEFQSSVVYAIYYAVSAFAAVPRDITMVLNIAGAILVVGGGILSFVLDRRRTYALVIALGALMNAIGGILLGILGDPEVFFYFEFLGIVFLFLGFLMSSRYVSRVAPVETRQVVTTAAGTT